MTFNEMIQPILKAVNATETNPARFGNVDFWIAEQGHFQGEVCYTIPVSKWDSASISRDITQALKHV